MSDTPFIKFWPSDFLGGTSGLSPAERGVYITLLCLIYEANGPIARDDVRLSRRCGSPKASFKKVLDALIDQEKFIEIDGMLMNERARKALIDRTNRTQNSTHAANQRWSAQEQKSEENQCQEDAAAMPPQCAADASQNPEPEPEYNPPFSPPLQGEPSAHGKPKPSSKKSDHGSRLTDDWHPSETDHQFARNEGLTDDDIKREADRFRDYWLAVPGQRGRKRDWAATWRNWVRRSDTGGNRKMGGRDTGSRRPPPHGSNRTSIYDTCFGDTDPLGLLGNNSR